MYLLTFTFLVIGMLGIYTQVLGVEAARLYQSQTSVAQAMIYWQEAAMSLANSVINPYPTLAAGGCSLTAAIGTACQHSAAISGPAAVTVNGGSYTTLTGGISYPFLPTGYSSANYPWKSVAYQNNGSYYVLTYVDPPGANSFLNSASGAQLGITQSDLFQQIVNTGLSNLAYGYVNSSATLITSATLGGNPVTYTVPPSPTVKPGSLGIISYTTPCGSC